ncbi:hypothetical protein JOQ06_019168 [Pogonophryne albipinna]|uniref:Uncharacterized protein n=2 Tax=Notothenioidei TaxID=8205 RepID=A0AAD6AQT5_9TELE|nr:hypothetical protein KUCAC02_003902 [Chaenocephalus aceratus]KAJ4930155.1 hypothetical protein JOQ06_019168 [Pogonophryne albipinna]
MAVFDRRHGVLPLKASSVTLVLISVSGLMAKEPLADSCDAMTQRTGQQLRPLLVSDSSTEQGGSGHQGSVCELE